MARMDRQAVSTQIRKRLEQEPAVADPTKITVDIEKKGTFLNRKYVVVLSGPVGSEAEGRRITKTVQDSFGERGEVEVENNLVVPLV